MTTQLKKQIIRLLFSFLFLISISIAHAQTGKTKNQFYLQTGTGLGPDFLPFFDLSLQSIFKNKWSATLSYQNFSMYPDNIPWDYHSAYRITGAFGFPLAEYIDDAADKELKLNFINLTAGRYFKLGKIMWATTEAGISLVNSEELNFIPASVIYGPNNSYSSNYKTTGENKTTVGASLRVDINRALGSFIGLGAGVNANINSIRSPVVFELKLLFGNTGKEKKNEK